LVLSTELNSLKTLPITGWVLSWSMVVRCAKRLLFLSGAKLRFAAYCLLCIWSTGNIIQHH